MAYHPKNAGSAQDWTRTGCGGGVEPPP